MNLDSTLQASYNDTVRALVQALDLHDPGEGDHAERVAVYSTATGEKMGLKFDDLQVLRRAAALHDVGKISISPNLLRKFGELTEEEINELRLHALMAMKLVESFEWLRPCVPLIKHHHERWDGEGYPDGLKGEDIPLGARIIGAAEAYDSMVTSHGVRTALSEEHARDELKANAGKQFDPAVVEAFLAVEPLIQPLDPLED
jgi:response regulator RpfG family c-di-GMP phosphodiesterase